MTSHEYAEVILPRKHILHAEDAAEIRVAIVRALQDAVARERSACVHYLEAEAAIYIGDLDDMSSEVAAAVWKALTEAASAIRARGQA